VKIIIERARCVGHARCAATAPQLFPLNDDGYVATDGFDVMPNEEALAARGARACPERVITIIDEDG
jgi:ferredoxin